jgi:hypothetical protein
MTAWFVSLAVRATVGAPDSTAQVSIGAVPPPPPPLARLAIPRRDPFAADAGSTPPAAPLAVSDPALAPSRGGPSAQLATTNVPDVAALGGAARNVGIVATIVSDGEAYALVEDGGSVRVARVGDVLGGSTIASITDQAVMLASGVRISLDEQRPSGGAPAAPPNAGTALATASPAPGLPAAARLPAAAPAAVSAGGEPTGARAPGRDTPAPGMPRSTTGSTTGISTFGHTVLTSPNGTPLPPPSQPQAAVSGTLFPTVFASPTVVPSGTTTTQPGGRP